MSTGSHYLEKREKKCILFSSLCLSHKKAEGLRGHVPYQSISWRPPLETLSDFSAETCVRLALVFNTR